MIKIKSFLFALGLVWAGTCFAEPLELIKKAEAVRLKTVEVGFEWTTTSILIAQAKQAVKDGKSELATELATKAIKQAEAGLKQAEFAAANWQDSEPD